MEESQNLFIVVSQSYSEGTTACAFWERESAEKYVNQDLEMVIKELTEQGYTSHTILRCTDSIEVYVADSNIYYQWEIIPSSVTKKNSAS